MGPLTIDFGDATGSITATNEEEEQEEKMGLGAGGKLKQQIYADPYECTEWWGAESRVNITIRLISPKLFTKLTGELLDSPITKESYEAAGIPWLDVYCDLPALPSTENFDGIQTVA